MSRKSKRFLLLHFPYVLFALMGTKLGQSWRYAPGAGFSEKLLHLVEGMAAAFQSAMPSFVPFDLFFGIIFAAIIWLAVYIRGQNAKKFRKNQEYGSARWGTAEDIAPYMDPDFKNNIILTKTEMLTMNNRPADPKTARNKNVLIIGGSGSGKSLFWVKPNLMQCNSEKYPVSFVVTDPKGSIVNECGKMLLHYGYKIKVLNTINFTKSMHYNPFEYIHSEKDILKLVTALIANTKGEGKGGDDFWIKAETLLYTALIGYIHYEAPKEEQCFSTLIEFINAMEVREDDEEFQNPVDIMFEELKKQKPDHFAVRQYAKYKLAAGKTAKSILVSAAVRLASFTLREIQDITDEDNLELSKLGERKQAIFCVIPDSNDVSLNFLVGMLYTQAFQELYYQADKVHMGGLPVPVRLMFDEFANVALPDGYARLQATMRSRNIMATIILQNISQLKALFKDDWEGIIGNADTFVYLGGNEQSTHKYISEQLGKETIDTKSSSQSKGRNGSFSQSFQQTGRDLMTPDEVRLLDNKNAIVFIRGERPVIDEKYDLMKHPNVQYTENGGAAPYVHSPHCLYDMRYLLSTMEEPE